MTDMIHHIFGITRPLSPSVLPAARAALRRLLIPFVRQDIAAMAPGTRTGAYPADSSPGGFRS